MTERREHDAVHAAEHAANTARYMRIMDVAAYLGLSRSAVYNLAKRGRLPTVRLGRTLLVDRQRFENGLNEQLDGLEVLDKAKDR